MKFVLGTLASFGLAFIILAFLKVLGLDLPTWALIVAGAVSGIILTVLERREKLRH